MDVADIPGVPDWLPDHLHEQGIESLYPPQAEAVDAGVTEGESLVASIPTASGKTLISALAMLASIERDGKALYIVPLRALASEKQGEFEEYEQYGLDVGVSTGNYESEGGWLADKDIVVATSEKVDSLVRNDAPWLDDLSCVVADEVHLVDDSERGPTLEVTLAKLRQLNSNLQTVALSATIGNANELADWLDAELVDSDWRPIELQKGVHYGDAMHLEDGSQSRVPVRNSEDQTAAVVRDTLEDDGSSLVFVNSRRNAEAAARRLTGTTEAFLSGEEREQLRDIAAEIRDVSDTETSEDLADAVVKGSAFHHAGLCVTAETQILRPDGTFNDVATLVERRPDEVVGLSDYDITPVDVTDTFEMGTRPVLKVRTRTGNIIRLSENHPLPVLRETGLEWVRAENLSPGEYVARPRQLDFDVKTPSFRSLVPDTHRVFREYDTVNRLTSQLEDPDTLPHSYYQRHKWDRNITVGDFRRLCEANGEDAPLLYDRVICDGGQKPIRIPEAVNENICWLSGVVAGDGYLRENSVVLTGSSELLSEYRRIAVEEFEREPVAGESSSSGTPYLSLGSTVVADIFAEHFGMSRGEGTAPRLPDIPLESNLLGAYVSGLFDADGSVSPRENSDGAPRVEFYSTSDTLITQLKTALLRFGIVAFRDRREVEGRVTEHDGRTIRSRQDVLRLTIYGTEQLRRFEEHIGFRHSGKSEKLRTAIDTNSNGNRRQNDVIPSEIGRRVRRRRNERGLSMSDLEPEIPKATLSRFENGKTPMKRTTFERLAEKLDDTLLCSLADAEVFWDRIEAIDEDGEEQLYDLSTESGNFVANGVIAHNTSDHRTLVEDAFRDRLLKVVSATPTLAAGVNTPSRRVVVRDWRRYDGTMGGMKPLSVLEVHQMMGRAGRPGLDPYGEAVLVASSHDELDELFERYVWADPEPVESKLAAEPALRTHILATVASNFARSRAGVLDFLEGTLYAEQTADRQRLEDVTDTVIEYLVRNDFLEREGDELSPTTLGHTVSRLYLDPMSAAEIIDGLRAAQRDTGPTTADASDAGEESGGFQTASEMREQTADSDDPPERTALGFYHLVARTPDMYELYLRSGDEERYTEIAYERENELLGRAPSEYEDRFDDWLSALKTARLLEDWASELEEDEITERYSIGPGDIRGKVETAQWLLGAAESLVSELDVDAVPAIREARTRAEHGVRSELVDLAGVRGVGRKRARRLFDAGIETRADLRDADKSVVLAALRGREKTAENVLENAGHRNPSMADVEPSGDVADERPGETSADGGDGETAAEDQANLGDF